MGNRKIIGKMLELIVVTIFKSNVYSFQSEIQVQEDWAPIGLNISGEIGFLETGEIDTAFTALCEENGIKLDLDSRYMDDRNQVLGVMPYGYRWVKHKVVYNIAWIEEDSKISEDLHTANILVDIANSIRASIQFVAMCHGGGV